MASGAAPSSRDKVRKHRARMRAKGMKLVQFWVPDVTSAEFKAEARRQSRLIALSPHDADDQAFIDSISEFWHPVDDQAS
jgi:hypothetical protein